MKGLIILAVIVVIALVAVGLVAYTVDETQQAVIIRMGNPVRTVQEPGLHFKWPYPIESVHMFDDRVLEYDVDPEPIYTQDKKNLILDNYARWRIEDPLMFMKAVKTRSGAQARLDDIVYSVLREELGKHVLSEVISENREKIMVAVTQHCREQAKGLGIGILDVRIKRADLPRENEEYVYNRMRAERSRIAMQYRSEGEEEALKIRAQTDLDKRAIMAEAYEKSEKLKGAGDAEALGIYANAYQKDPNFYAFTRTLQAYEKAIDEHTVLVLPPTMEFFKYL
ncbi:MAG: protease modulator HflC, partial [Candidatus Latescibacteria bacterium]|nr:protease modulator HflC [Candidatus Latescibacterota bacterium]